MIQGLCKTRLRLIVVWAANLSLAVLMQVFAEQSLAQTGSAKSSESPQSNSTLSAPQGTDKKEIGTQSRNSFFPFLSLDNLVFKLLNFQADRVSVKLNLGGQFCCKITSARKAELASYSRNLQTCFEDVSFVMTESYKRYKDSDPKYFYKERESFKGLLSSSSPMKKDLETLEDLENTSPYSTAGKAFTEKKNKAEFSSGFPGLKFNYTREVLETCRSTASQFANKRIENSKDCVDEFNSNAELFFIPEQNLPGTSGPFENTVDAYLDCLKIAFAILRDKQNVKNNMGQKDLKDAYLELKRKMQRVSSHTGTEAESNSPAAIP